MSTLPFDFNTVFGFQYKSFWINMTTALALGMMLIFEPKEAHIMNRPPRSQSAPMLSRTIIQRIMLTSAIILVGVFGLFVGR